MAHSENKLTIGDEIELDGVKYRVKKITFTGATLLPSSKTHVEMTDKKGKKHVFDTTGKTTMISSDYCGEAIRNGKKFAVLGRSDYLRLKGINPLDDEGEMEKESPKENKRGKVSSANTEQEDRGLFDE